MFVDREQLGRVFSVLIPAAVYVGAIQLIGIYVASAIYIALFMVILGKYSWVKSVVAALVVNVVFFLMFEVWFKVPLLQGQLRHAERPGLLSQARTELRRLRENGRTKRTVSRVCRGHDAR